MNTKIEEKLQRIKSKILENTNAIKIILFGSYAHDTQNPESDLDICIITNDTKRKKEILRDIRRSIIDEADIPMDLLVYRSDEFEQKAAVENSFENVIKKYGITLYG